MDLMLVPGLYSAFLASKKYHKCTLKVFCRHKTVVKKSRIGKLFNLSPWLAAWIPMVRHRVGGWASNIREHVTINTFLRTLDVLLTFPEPPWVLFQGPYTVQRSKSIACVYWIRLRFCLDFAAFLVEKWQDYWCGSAKTTKLGTQYYMPDT